MNFKKELLMNCKHSNVLNLINEISKPISLQKQELSLPYVLREIKLKALDGTNLQSTKLGGTPNWIQNDDTPVCLSCREKMSLVAQIDSFDDDWKKLKGDNRFYFNDNGRIYVFFPYCDCGEDPAIILQSF